ncbi:unnamed protein product [Hymenolepis diminuta]|uniref:Uncharacterized protein n=1 Tax=Hymenolepis diminuta TaxID=6216 RepID=A0A564Z0F9_HYMDI|nr:unnamed protein product [Hymenolepis diminuta]
MLLREFNRSDNYLCSFFLQPMDPADLTYDNSSLFNLIISEDENVHHYVGIVDRLCIGLRFGSLEENQLKCFIFILGLRSPCHASVPLGQEVSSQTQIC